MRRRVDVLQGRGEIFQMKGPAICPAAYSLETWQDAAESGRGPAAGLTRTEGRIEAPAADIARLLRHSPELQIQLSDGRWLDFAFTSPSGTVVGLGAIRDTR